SSGDVACPKRKGRFSHRRAEAPRGFLTIGIEGGCDRSGVGQRVRSDDQSALFEAAQAGLQERAEAKRRLAGQVQANACTSFALQDLDRPWSLAVIGRPACAVGGVQYVL